MSFIKSPQRTYGRISMSKKTTSFFESLVTAAILLVLIHTFIEDLSIIIGWDMSVRQKLVYAGFFFDLFFSIEFLVRLYNAIVEKRVIRYLTADKGWIDFLASIPLLLLNSGPTALAFLTEETALIGIGGILNILKVIKSIRIARVLRFLRILKIFRRIKYADSPMVQRHVANISTISITIIVFSLFGFTLAKDFLNLPGYESAFAKGQENVIQFLEEAKDNEKEFLSRVSYLKDTVDEVLIIKRAGETTFSRYSNEYYTTIFGPGEYAYLQGNGFELFFDQRPLSVHIARESLFFFGIVILMVLAFMIIYSPHFAITISDPIHVMRKGIEDKAYNLEVRIPSRYEEDDVFRLASLYNEVFLPLKDRNAPHDETATIEMDMDDLKDLME